MLDRRQQTEQTGRHRLADSVLSRVGLKNEMLSDRPHGLSQLFFSNIWCPTKKYMDASQGMHAIESMKLQQEYAFSKSRQAKMNIWTAVRPKHQIHKPQRSNTPRRNDQSSISDSLFVANQVTQATHLAIEKQLNKNQPKVKTPSAVIKAPVHSKDWKNHHLIMQDIIRKQARLQMKLRNFVIQQRRDHLQSHHRHLYEYSRPAPAIAVDKAKLCRRSVDTTTAVIAPSAMPAKAPEPQQLPDGRQVLSEWILNTHLRHQPINWKTRLLLALHEPLRHGLVFLLQQAEWVIELSTALLVSDDIAVVPTEQHINILFQWLERFQSYARTQSDLKKQDVMVHVIFKRVWRKRIEQHYLHVFVLLSSLLQSKTLLKETMAFCDSRAAKTPSSLQQFALQLTQVSKIIRVVTSTLEEALQWEEKTILFALQSIGAEDVCDHMVSPLLSKLQTQDIQWVLATSLRWGGRVEFDALCSQLGCMRWRLHGKRWRGQQVVPAEPTFRIVKLRRVK